MFQPYRSNSFLFSQASENTYEKLLEMKKKGIKFTENERKWFHKLDKWAKIRNGSPLWERNKHGEVVRAKYELICSHTAQRSGTTNLYKFRCAVRPGTP